MHFNPRSSCEERLYDDMRTNPNFDFNPRSSCEERLNAMSDSTDMLTFQSTLLMRGATVVPGDSRRSMMLFQSTLLMRGATGLGFCCSILLTYFNPRSSCEERLLFWFVICKAQIFQSTLLMRGATISMRRQAERRTYFNPRSSCEERPVSDDGDVPATPYFNPRSSCEERRCSRLV